MLICLEDLQQHDRHCVLGTLNMIYPLSEMKDQIFLLSTMQNAICQRIDNMHYQDGIEILQ